MDCPILVWVICVNREVTRDEYEDVYRVAREAMPQWNLKHQFNAESLRHSIAALLPVLMMRHRRVPRNTWKDMRTHMGKHYIEKVPEIAQLSRSLSPCIGYDTTWFNSLVGMAMVQGRINQVPHIGFGVKQIAVDPPGVTVGEYMESVRHKLTNAEFESLKQVEDQETALRRLSIIFALKQAYIKALGQPIGYDWSRLDFDIPENRLYVDKELSTGWEFRIFQINLGVVRSHVVPPSAPASTHSAGSSSSQQWYNPNPHGKGVVEECYQCVVAFWRGFHHTSFLFLDNPEHTSNWIQFISIEQLIKVMPRLNT